MPKMLVSSGAPVAADGISSTIVVQQRKATPHANRGAIGLRLFLQG